MMLRLRNALRGSVRVEVLGKAPERFLNLCAVRGAAFWDVRREEPERLTASVTVPGYFLICAAARGGGCHVRAVRKQGLPFRARRLVQRQALVVCAMLCAAAVWWLTGFVWTIGISGCKTVTERELLSLLDDAGLRTGVKKRSVDGAQVRDTLLLCEGRLAFVTVNLTGCHAEVEVRERDQTPAPEDETPCNIISDKAGVIVRLRVTAGKAAVEVGQTVLPGDLLASGSMESTQGALWQVPARAEADLRTWRTLESVTTEQALAREYTGRVQKRCYLVLGTRRFPLEIVEKPSFACYDKQIEQKELTLREDFRFRIALVIETEREYLPVSAAPNAQALERRLEERLRAALSLALNGREPISARFTLTETAPFHGALEAECIETAGVPVPLG